MNNFIHSRDRILKHTLAQIVFHEIKFKITKLLNSAILVVGQAEPQLV